MRFASSVRNESTWWKDKVRKGCPFTAVVSGEAVNSGLLERTYYCLAIGLVPTIDLGNSDIGTI